MLPCNYVQLVFVVLDLGFRMVGFEYVNKVTLCLCINLSKVCFNNEKSFTQLLLKSYLLSFRYHLQFKS